MRAMTRRFCSGYMLPDATAVRGAIDAMFKECDW